MGNRVLLTDKRKEILKGNYDKKDSTDRAAKSRFQDSAEVALNELIEVAESPIIDNEEVFDPGTVGKLVASILSDGGGLMKPSNHRNETYVYVDQALRTYQILVDTEEEE